MSAPTTNQIRQNVWKTYLGALLGGFGFFYNTIETLYYRNFGLSFEQIGLALSAGLFVTLLLEIPTGAFADLYGKKLSKIVASLAYCIATALVVFGSTFPLFLGGFIFWGIARAFSSGASSAFLFDTLKALGEEKLYLQHQGRLSGIFISIDVISGLICPLMFAYNVRLPYMVSLTFAVIKLLVDLSVVEALSVEKSKLEFTQVVVGNITHIKKGFAVVFRNRFILWLISYNCLLVTLGKVFAEMVSSPFLIDYVGFSLASLGVITAFASAIQACTVFLSDKLERHLGVTLLLFLTLLTGPFSIAIYAFSSDVVSAGLLMGVIYANWTLNEVLLESQFAHAVNDSERATTMSIGSMIASLTALVFLPAIGAFIDTISLFHSMLFLAGSLFLGLSILLILKRKL